MKTALPATRRLACGPHRIARREGYQLCIPCGLRIDRRLAALGWCRRVTCPRRNDPCSHAEENQGHFLIPHGDTANAVCRFCGLVYLEKDFPL